MYIPRNKGHKTVVMLCLGLLIASITACGDNKNKTNSNNMYSTNNQPNWPNFSSQQANLLNQAKSNVQCNKGPRINTDYTFHTTSSFSQTTIGGNMNLGHLPGEVSDLFIGTSAFGDLIFVSKVTNGYNIQGYNITISMCQDIPLYMENRPLSRFRAPAGIVLNNESRCGFTGTATSMNTYVEADQYQTTNPNGIPVTYGPVNNIPTTFFKPNCNY